MVAADLPGTDEERAEAALIAAAGQLLGDSHREIPADFVAEIFAHAVPEDLLRYDPRQLAELAADAWSLLAVRKPGVPNIRLDTVLYNPDDQLIYLYYTGGPTGADSVGLATSPRADGQ